MAREKITAPEGPRRVNAQALKAAAKAAKNRAKGKPRTPAEVDQVLDLILEHLALDED